MTNAESKISHQLDLLKSKIAERRRLDRGLNWTDGGSMKAVLSLGRGVPPPTIDDEIQKLERRLSRLGS